jgi:hypothetical protein
LPCVCDEGANVKAAVQNNMRSSKVLIPTLQLIFFTILVLRCACHVFNTIVKRSICVYVSVEKQMSTVELELLTAAGDLIRDAQTLVNAVRDQRKVSRSFLRLF